jgi:hypothetical protein
VGHERQAQGDGGDRDPQVGGVVGLVEGVSDSSKVGFELAEACAHPRVGCHEQRGVDMSGEALTAGGSPARDLSPVVQLGERLGRDDELVADQVAAVLLLGASARPCGEPAEAR